MKFALIGNPNVGKSLIFNQLTGLGVEVSNFPGTTIDLKLGNVCFQKERVELVDLPGIYTLDGSSEEEKTVRDFLIKGSADAVIVILDATKLERNFYLLLQVAEFRLPMIIVVNILDEAEKQGLSIDQKRLAEIFGVKVLGTSAASGKNIDQIIFLAHTSAGASVHDVPYDFHVEAALKSLQKLYSTQRQENLLALQGIGNNADLVEAAGLITAEIEAKHRMSINQIIATNRYNEAERIAVAVVQAAEPQPRFNLDRILTHAFPGIPILIATMVSMLFIVFFVGSLLEKQIVAFFNSFALQPIAHLGLPPLASQLLVSFVIALQAGLGIALPFVFTFYILISILEDSGYMTRAAFLADRAMHHIGLHGEAIIPIVLGFGCNVPALMSIKLLKSRRERTIASVLITMVPCSARTVIIAGIVAAFIGILWAFSIYFVVLVLLVLTGLALSRITPGERFGMVLEMAPLRYPSPSHVLKKSWMHIRNFFYIAMPLLLVTSILLGIFQYIGAFDTFSQLIAPVSTAVLGLPAYASTSLLFGILRKEMAFEMLAVLAGTANLGAVMTPVQLYTFAIVSTLFVPCVSTIAVLYREMGGRIALLTSAYTVFCGVAIGALINILMK